MNKRLTAILMTSSLTLVLAVARPSEAAPLAESLSGEAKVDFDAAKVLFEDGDFAGAASKFQQAYDRARDPRILWNVAVCEKAQRHYVRVRVLVERYLADGKDVLGAEQVSAATAVLETIKAFIGTARIDAEPGAEIVIDGERAGTTPLERPIPLDLGKHQIKAEKPGHKPFTSTFAVEGAAETAVPVALVRLDTKAHVTVTAREGDSIRFDDRLVGLARWQADVEAGPHTLRVTAPKHKPYELRLDLAPGSTRSFDVVLENEGRPLWPFIAGGVALVGAAAVGGYFLFRPDARAADQPSGSLAPGLVNLSVLR